MKRTFPFALLLMLGCSAADPATTPVPAEGGAGSGGVAGSAGSGGAAGQAGAAGAAGVTAGGAGAAVDAAADVPPVPEPRPEAGPDTAETSLSDRQGSDGAEGGSDAITPDVVDAAADVRVEAGSDAAPDAGIIPVCPVPTNSNCASAIETDAMIRATFPQPCSPEGQTKCGGVYYGPPNNLTMTYPILCRSGIWRFGGSWSGSQWVPSHYCSTGCAASQICDP